VRKLDGGDAREKTWWDCAKDDMKSFGLSCEDAQDKDDWRSRGKLANKVYLENSR